MHANVIVDDEMKVWADGVLVGQNGIWSQAKVQYISGGTNFCSHIGETIMSTGDCEQVQP